jgi:sigma-B regulation protein RsbU (phosphoserine phosphatase)
MALSPQGLCDGIGTPGHAPLAPAPWPGLEEARRVQQRLFPSELPRLPGWDLAAACRPARVVAGDYCDLLDLGAGRLGLVLGDVSGKGLGPALVMAGLRALVHARLPHRTADLAGLMGELNAYLLATTPDDMFVTLFLAVLDVPTGRLRHVNAGHLPPLVLADPDGAGPMRITLGGPVLGILPEVDFEEHQAGLKPGSLLAVFSDGITEAMNRAGKMFHERRVVEALRKGWGQSAVQALAHLLEAVEQFAAGMEQADDMSVILLRRAG